MKIECELKVGKEITYGVVHFETVKVTLEGNWSGILKLVEELKFDLEMAKRLELK